MKKIITSIFNCFKKRMENYAEVYREAYKDPGFMIMEGYTLAGNGYYL